MFNVSGFHPYFIWSKCHFVTFANLTPSFFFSFKKKGDTSCHFIVSPLSPFSSLSPLVKLQTFFFRFTPPSLFAFCSPETQLETQRPVSAPTFSPHFWPKKSYIKFPFFTPLCTPPDPLRHHNPSTAERFNLPTKHLLTPLRRPLTRPQTYTKTHQIYTFSPILSMVRHHQRALFPMWITI